MTRTCTSAGSVVKYNIVLYSDTYFNMVIAYINDINKIGHNCDGMSTYCVSIDRLDKLKKTVVRWLWWAEWWENGRSWEWFK